MGECIHRSNEARIILCPSKSGSIENYVLIPVEGDGLVVIKQEIVVNAKKE